MFGVPVFMRASDCAVRACSACVCVGVRAGALSHAPTRRCTHDKDSLRLLKAQNLTSRTCFLPWRSCGPAAGARKPPAEISCMISCTQHAAFRETTLPRAWRDLCDLSFLQLSRLISLAPCAASARDPQSTSHTYVSPRSRAFSAHARAARRRRPVCAAPRSRFGVFTCARATAPPPPQKLNQPRLSSDHLLVSSPERPRAVATPMHTRCVHGAHCCSRSCSLLTLPSSLLCSLALWGSCPHGWSSKTPQDVPTSRARTRA